MRVGQHGIGGAAVRPVGAALQQECYTCGAQPNRERFAVAPPPCSCVGHCSPLKDNAVELKEGDLVKM